MFITNSEVKATAFLGHINSNAGMPNWKQIFEF